MRWRAVPGTPACRQSPPTRTLVTATRRTPGRTKPRPRGRSARLVLFPPTGQLVDDLPHIPRPGTDRRLRLVPARFEDADQEVNRPGGVLGRVGHLRHSHTHPDRMGLRGLVDAPVVDGAAADFEQPGQFPGPRGNQPPGINSEL